MKDGTKLQLAKYPCFPPYGIVVGDDELADTDCSASTIEGALSAAAEHYPGAPVIGFDDPRHYSNRGRARA